MPPCRLQPGQPTTAGAAAAPRRRRLEVERRAAMGSPPQQSSPKTRGLHEETLFLANRRAPLA